MPALPTAADIPKSTIDKDTFHARFLDLLAALAGLLGTDGTPATARTALGIETGTDLGNIPIISTITGATETKSGLVVLASVAQGEAGTAADVVMTPEATAAAIAALGVPAGAVEYFAMNTAPSGWLKANGALVSRTTYAALFAKIGTTFGAGDGSTTFALPDLRGEFVRGWDDGRGVDSGRVFGSAQADQMQSHTHSVQVIGDSSITGGGYPNGEFQAGTIPAYTTGSAGGGSETRPRNIALLACIKY